jgi:hypothetical protein
VEIVFLIIGMVLLAVGMGVIVSEARARRDTQPVQARVIGFSLGKSNNPNIASFHPVAEYVGLNGRKYYIEGSVGSSVPLHAVGQVVQVLTRAGEPEKTVLKSGLSYILGSILALLGLVALGVFWLTFRLNIFSIVMAVIVIAGLATKLRSAWRKEPLSLEAWNAYRRKILSTHVFSEESRNQILWADPIRLASAVEGYRKTNRFAVPVLLLLGLGLLFFTHHFYQRTRTFLDSADYAIGTVVELRQRDSTDGDSTYSAVVKYNDRRGTDFEFVDSFSSSPPYYHTGETVHVLYNRAAPNNAQIDRGLANYWLTALLGLLGGAFLFMGLHSARRQLRWRAVRPS